MESLFMPPHDERIGLSVVVLNFNDWRTTAEFVHSIAGYDAIDSIMVVDNQSTDDSYEKLLKLKGPKVEVFQTDKNGGYGYGNNAGFLRLWETTRPRYVAISNPDVEVSEEVIRRSLAFIRDNPSCGILAPVMKMSDGRKNYRCAWRLPSFWQYLLFPLAFAKCIRTRMYYTHPELDRGGALAVGCVLGAFLIVDSLKFIECGMYDENLFLYCEETVLGFRMQKIGAASFLLRNDYYVHRESASINKSIPGRIRQLQLRWKSRRYVLENYYPPFFSKGIAIAFFKTLSLIQAHLVALLCSLGLGRHKSGSGE